MLFSLAINISSLFMLNLSLLLQFFLILRIYHLFNDSSHKMCMKDVDQLYFFLELLHYLRLLLRLLMCLLLLSLLFCAYQSISSLYMVFQLFCPLLMFHHITHKLLSMSVDKKHCRRNFWLFRITIHGKLFLVLQLLSPLGVNKCTQLSFSLIELQINLKHKQLLLRINKSMEWITRRLFLPL